MGPPGIPKTGLDRLGDLHKTYTKSRLFGAISFYFVASIPEMDSVSHFLVDWLWDLIPQGKVQRFSKA
jgi:hypothetical protein